MSFGKNLFVFVSGAVVGAGALAGFAGWQMYKALKKNDILYTAVRSSVDAGVKAASSEFSEHGAKAILNKFFGWSEKRNKISYDDYYDHPCARSGFYTYTFYNVEFESKNEADLILSQMKNAIERYGKVTVHELCLMADVIGSTDSNEDSIHGWINLHGVKVRNKDGRWVIDFPDPIKLE